MTSGSQAAESPSSGGYDMAHLWQKVEAGRYAAKYQNCILEVIRNPDYPDDPRRYQACVNSRPIDVPKHSLKDAQSTAVRHVIFAGQSARPRVEQQPVEPLPVAEIVDADFVDVEPPQDEPQPDEPRALPPPAAEPQPVTFTITGTVTTSDHIAAMSDIRAAVEMLRSVATTQCRIVPPEFIDL